MSLTLGFALLLSTFGTSASAGTPCDKAASRTLDLVNPFPGSSSALQASGPGLLDLNPFDPASSALLVAPPCQPPRNLDLMNPFTSTEVRAAGPQSVRVLDIENPFD